MKQVYTLIAIISLVLVLIPPVLYLLGGLEKPLMSTLMLLGTIFWFATGIRQQMKINS